MDMAVPDVPIDLTRAILGSAIAVHRELGPGLLESTYRTCFVEQLEADGMKVETETAIHYRGRALEAAYRADVIVERRVLIELKAVENLSSLHEAQTLTYLRHARLKVGLLINFNVPRLIAGCSSFHHMRPLPLAVLCASPSSVPLCHPSCQRSVPPGPNARSWGCEASC